jgi:hypothetical protein
VATHDLRGLHHSHARAPAGSLQPSGPTNVWDPTITILMDISWDIYYIYIPETGTMI